jgi:hypothetical protein
MPVFFTGDHIMLSILKKLFCQALPENDSSGSITIRANGRDTFLCVERERQMTVYAELSMGKPERRIFMESIKHWEKPFETDQVTEEKRREILSALCRYLDKHRMSYEIVQDDREQQQL